MFALSSIAWGIITFLAYAAAGGWLLVRALKKSDDPGRLVVKWVVTLIFFPLGVFAVGWAGPFGMPILIICGLIVGSVWAPSIGAILAKPLTSMFDGGDEPPDPQPFYSIAQAKRKQGKYDEAMAEVQKQLEHFPNDYTGHMLLAEIQVEDLKDLAAAEITVRRVCHLPEQTPQNIAGALRQLADWHLQYAHDPEAARQDLEEIVERFPGTEAAQMAAQRIAHLATPEIMAAAQDRRPITVTHHEERLGLVAGQPRPEPAEDVAATRAVELVRHLEQHPFDSAAREKLALIYVEHYQRFDLATQELEQLIDQPNQPTKQIVHFLNLLADLQVKHVNDAVVAAQTLQRIIDRYPGSAAAENARRRIALLKLETKADEKSQPIKLGTYEKNLGLKKP